MHPLKLELQVVMSCPMGMLGTEFGSSGRAGLLSHLSGPKRKLCEVKANHKNFITCSLVRGHVREAQAGSEQLCARNGAQLGILLPQIVNVNTVATTTKSHFFLF